MKLGVSSVLRDTKSFYQFTSVEKIYLEQKEKELTKAEFKALYFQHANPYSGWTPDYWNTFFEKEVERQYFVYPSENPNATQMFIRSEGNKHCIFFLSEESEESFFDFPGKD